MDDLSDNAIEKVMADAWGIRSLKPFQKQSISQLVNNPGSSLLLVQQTGLGKSAVMQGAG